MTTVTLPTAPSKTPQGARVPRRPRPAVLIGTLIAVWAAILGLAGVLLLVIFGWVTAPHAGGSLSGAFDVALQLWLAAHRTGLAVAGGHLGLTPLGLTLALGWLLNRAGRLSARALRVEQGRQVARATAAVALPYAITAALVTAPAASAAIRPVTAQALLGALALSSCAVAFGVLGEAGLRRALWKRLPAMLRTAVAAGAAAVGVLLATGAVVLVASLLAHSARVGELGHALAPGRVGTVLLVLVCLAVAPNAMVWSASFAAGPGFAVGAGTSVTLVGARLGDVPAFPLLAALPGSGPLPAVVWLALAGPVLAGVAAGVVVLRANREAGPSRLVVPVLWSALPSAVILAGLAALAGGSLGPGRLATLGPSPWLAGLAIGGEVAAIGLAVVAGWSAMFRKSRELSPR